MNSKNRNDIQNMNQQQNQNDLVVVKKEESPDDLVVVRQRDMFELLDDLNKTINTIKRLKTHLADKYTIEKISPQFLARLHKETLKLQKDFNEVYARKDSFLNEADGNTKYQFKVNLYRAKGGYQNLTRGQSFGMFTPLKNICEELKDPGSVQKQIIENAFKTKEKQAQWSKSIANYFSAQFIDSFKLMIRCFTFGMFGRDSGNKDNKEPQKDRPTGEEPLSVEHQVHNAQEYNYSNAHDGNSMQYGRD